MATKINKILKLWKPGLVLTSSYLKEKGLTYILQSQYQKSGWLESIGNGAVKRAGDGVSWAGAINALQQQLKLDVHIGGKSALVQQGYGHYVQQQENLLYLFIRKETKLPKWFLRYDWSQKLHVTRTAFLPIHFENSFSNKIIDGFELRVPVPERAVLEMLYFVPSKQGFDEALKIMESLTSLRPEMVQQLLQECRSIKVKRLFLYMAEKHNHFWFEQLNPDKINLGSGKRMLVKDGALDKKYLITVPKEF